MYDERFRISNCDSLASCVHWCLLLLRSNRINDQAKLLFHWLGLNWQRAKSQRNSHTQPVAHAVCFPHIDSSGRCLMAYQIASLRTV